MAFPSNFFFLLLSIWNFHHFFNETNALKHAQSCFSFKRILQKQKNLFFFLLLSVSFILPYTLLSTKILHILSELLAITTDNNKIEMWMSSWIWKCHNGAYAVKNMKKKKKQEAEENKMRFMFVGMSIEHAFVDVYSYNYLIAVLCGSQSVFFHSISLLWIERTKWAIVNVCLLTKKGNVLSI